MPLSYSQLSTYHRCPQQYAFAHVERIPRPLSTGESFGSSIHNALKRWGELELLHASPPRIEQTSLFDDGAHGTLPPLSLKTLQRMMREAFIAEGYPSAEAMDAALTRAMGIAEVYHQWWASQKRCVLAVEEGFRIDLGSPSHPITLAGRFDRVERVHDTIVVYDYKTSAVRSQEDIDTDLQLSIYAIAAEERWGTAPTLALLFLDDAGVTAMHTKRHGHALEEARRLITTTARAIDTRDFHPTPSAALCRRCPYRTRCPFAAQ